MAILTDEQIMEMGFAHIGKNVHLSDKASFYNCAAIHIGNNVRIDDFCVLSAGAGGIHLGNYVHIAVYSSLMGAGNITLHDFSGLSSKVAIYSSNDDYSGSAMTNPCIPSDFTNVMSADVSIGRHAIIGSGSIVLPGINIGDGAAIAALSLVNHNCAEFEIYSGTPAKRIKSRKRDLLEVEKQFLSLQNGHD